jgi:flagellar assembly factor FliW
MVDATADASVLTIDLPRFGTISYREDDLIVFPWGIPGFDHLKSFLILSLPGQEHLVWIQSLEDLDVALPAADPWLYFPSYDPALPAFARISLDLNNPEDFTILAIVVAPGDGSMFMNLMAPVVVNLVSRVARQVALEASGYTVAMPIPLIDAAPAQAEPAPE